LVAGAAAVEWLGNGLFPGRRQSPCAQVLYCASDVSSYCTPLETNNKALNAELTKKALEKVGNPNVLVNLISRRVRQLNSGGGASSRPLVGDTGNLGAADIALLEIIEDKMGFEVPELAELTRPVGRKRKKH
jgi:DNA-directed RNA polymerase subunit omega